MTLFDFSPLMTVLAIGVPVVFVAALLRYVPHILAPLGIGVDQWYWKEYIEHYGSQRKFPPELPQYLLESHQWYPPLFPLLMARLPHRIFDRYSHIVAIVIDLLRLIWLMAVMYRITNDPVVMGIAGGVYAITPLLISYNVQLNPRGLAALMLDFIVIAVLLTFYFNGPLWLWLAPIPVLGMLLLTHKMNTQLFWFLCLASGLIWDWKLLLLIPLSVLVAILISRGFYWKVLRHHWDIVSFWNRNWPWLGANPILESPIYGDPGYETPRKLHRKGAIGFAKHVYSQLGYNPFAWLMVVILPLYPLLPIPAGGFLHFVIAWLALVLFFSVATSFVAPLRCLGAGHFYLYNGAFPAAVLWGLLYQYWGNQNVVAFLVLGAIASGLGIVRFYVHVRQSGTVKIDRDFEAALGFLAAAPKGTVMCGATQWYDVVAYKTRQPVLFGGHGYGFKMLEPTYPRLMLRVSDLICRYGLRYILFSQGSASEKFLEDLPHHAVYSFGQYRVASIDGSEATIVR